MKHGWKQMLAALLTAALLIALLPMTDAGRALAVGNYGKTTDTGVALRKTASTKGEIWFRVDLGTVASILETTSDGKIQWYKVIMEWPGSVSGNTYIGYINGDYFARLSAEEAKAWEASPVNKTNKYGLKSNGATGRLTNSGVNIRQEPSLKAHVITKVDRNTIVDLLSIPAPNDPDPWYQVAYAGSIGYIQGPFIQVLDSGSAVTPTAIPGTVTPTPTAADNSGSTPATVVTPAPEPQPVTGTGYARLLLSSTPLCVAPNGNSTAEWSGVGSTLPVVGAPVMMAGASWYPVSYLGGTYYVRGDAVQLTTTEGTAPAASNSGASVTPAPAATGTGLGYVKTIKGDVNLRLKPAGNVIVQLKRNTVAVCLAAPVEEEGYDWYYVQVDNLKGYLRDDCIAACDANGNLTGSATPAPAVITPAPAAVDYGYVRTITTGVNLRQKPAGLSQEQIAINVVLPVTGPAVTSGFYTWYPVKAASGRSGYLRGDCVVVTDASGNAAPATTAPAAVTPTPAGNVVYGYIQVTKAGTNVRKEPAGDAFVQVKKGTVWPLTGAKTVQSNYGWYPVNVNNRAGYIRDDCAVMLTEAQVQAYLAGQGIPVVTVTPTPTPAPTPAPVNVVQTVLTGVWLRKAASKDSQAVDQVKIGTVMTFTDFKTVGGSTWYNIVHNGKSLWVLGSCVKVLSAEEYAAYIAANPTVTVEPAVTATPAPTGYVKTTKSGVNVRSTAGGKVVLGQVAKNKVFAYTNKTHSGNYDWYRVTTTYGVGWVRGDCVSECQANGSALPVITPTPAPTSTSGSSPAVIVSSQREASYSILKVGSSGTAVRNLVQELINQGFYSGAVTSSYTTDVEAAVKAFQTAKGLTVDGIAGSATQHKLFNTVPVGTADGSDMSFVIYPAEKIDWFTGGIQELWPRGANVKVYDVKTGIVWWAHRWAGAYHADIEPLTAADTARLCAIYGVSKPKDIETKNLYQRRPCLVTIGNRTFACALYGIPHNYGAGDISNNNFPGQICMHFTNSKTHGSKIVYYLNTNAIQYAWENAPNGHK